MFLLERGRQGFQLHGQFFFFSFGMHLQGFTDFLMMSLCFIYFSLKKSDQTSNIKFQGHEKCRLNASQRQRHLVEPSTWPPTVEKHVAFMRMLRIPPCGTPGHLAGEDELMLRLDSTR